MKWNLCLCLSVIITFAIGAEHLWRWQRVDCIYHKNIENLFEHCSPLEQEFVDAARKKCGERNWTKLQKWIDCGCPEATIIKANNIQEAYKAFILHQQSEIYLKNLPLQNLKKEIDDNSFIRYIWKNPAHLKVEYAFDAQSRCDYICFFDLGEGNVKIVRRDNTACE